MREFGQPMKKTIDAIPRNSLDALKRHRWPGNIRELRNVIERAMIVSQGEVLHVEVPPPTKASPARPAEILNLDEVQRQHILTVLESTGWRISGPHGAADLLGVKPTTLEYRINKLGISRPGEKPK